MLPVEQWTNRLYRPSLTGFGDSIAVTLPDVFNTSMDFGLALSMGVKDGNVEPAPTSILAIVNPALIIGGSELYISDFIDQLLIKGLGGGMQGDLSIYIVKRG